MKLFSRNLMLSNQESDQQPEAEDPATGVDEQAVADAVIAIGNSRWAEKIELQGPAGDALRELRGALRELFERELERSVDFSSRLSDSMVAVSNMADDVRAVGDNSQSMAAAVEEMAASTNQVASASNETSGAAQTAQDAAQHGISQIARAIEAMQHISEVAQNLASRLDVLENAASQIEGMAQTIEEISDQTKLLALNATIEAARAGDAGKGFAVVASEVKSLSEQTSKATDHIRESIEALNGEMSEMKQAMTASAEAVAQGEEIVGEVGGQINGIVEQVSGVNTRMAEIASVLDQQRQATGEISEQISTIADRASRAKHNVNDMIQAVGSSEALIDEQFASLEDKDISNYVLHRAKSDHMIWKKKLAEMLSGLNSLEASELADHHSCRLGKWYDQVTDPGLKNDPRFRTLVGPHEQVHSHGKRAAELYASGQRDEAHAEYEKMEQASVEVIRLLNELTQSPPQSAAYLDAAE